jgi:hypothetical protein
MLLGACAFQAGSKAGEARRGGFAAPSPIPLDGRRDVRGELQALEGGRVVIRTRQGPVTVHTDDETMVFDGGGVGVLSDLKEGEPVRASVAEDGGRDVALWIETPRPPPPGGTDG